MTTDTTTGPPTTRRYLEIPPGELLLDRNLRRDEALDRAFLDSLKQNGVLVPIVAVETDEGELRVRYGHRRTAGAVKVGLLTVPVLVVGPEDDDETDRIVGQWVENEQRRGLTVNDRVAAVSQLAAFGLPAGDIAKRTSASRADVDAAIAVGESKVAAKVAARHTYLTLDQALVIAEMDDDKTVVKELLDAAKKGTGFEHLAQRKRDDRERAAAVAAEQAKLVEAGIEVLTEAPKGGGAVRPLHNLRSLRAKANAWAPLTPAEHKKCPHRAALVRAGWNGVVDTTHYCLDYVGGGHTLISVGQSGPEKPDTPEAVEAAKVERRRIREENAAWKSATTVRVGFVVDRLLARVAMPKTAAAYVATEVAAGEVSTQLGVGGDKVHVPAARYLGLMKPAPEGGDDKGYLEVVARGRYAADALIDAVPVEKDPLRVALAVYAAAIESEITTKLTRRAWGRYLTFLASAGYDLSEVELTVRDRCAGITHDTPEETTDDDA